MEVNTENGIGEEMKKVAVIIQRYGEEVSGGGEFYARALASHLAEFYDVTVLTTTSLDLTFEKHYCAGEFEEGGVRIIRFDNSRPRNFAALEKVSYDMTAVINAGRPTHFAADLQWADEWGPYCPRVVKYVEDMRDGYDVFIIFTYIYFTTIRCLPLVKDKVIFIPTAHDEIWARPVLFQKLFSLPRFIGFLTKGEEEFVRGFYHNDKVPGEIIGCGVDLPGRFDHQSFRKKFHIRDPYIAYVGRVDISKGCDELVCYFLKYKKRNNIKLKLVLMGEGNIGSYKNDDIIFTGFVTEQEKFDCISGALLTVAPSRYESLCIAVLESFSCGIPILANGKCKILKAHCQNGRSGYSYSSEKEFMKRLDEMVHNEEKRKKMGIEAKKYIDENYTWDIVIKKMNKMISGITENPVKEEKADKHNINEFRLRNVFMDEQFRGEVIYANKKTTIVPAFEDSNAVAVCFTSSDYFAPMCSVAVSSLIENASLERKYDILVLTQGMSDRNKKLIAGMSEGHCSIRFVEFEEGLFSSEIANHDSYNVYTYYRLMIPSICKKYGKVLYLDSDMVIHKDVSKIFDADIDGYYAAAVLDLTILTWQVMKERHPLYSYLESLNLTEPGTYMQGGVAVYNIQMINDSYPVDVLIKKANERHYQNCDQELLNMCFKGKIKFLAPNWNVVVMHPAYIDLYKYWMPRKYYDMYIKARKDPYIIHYSFQQIPCYQTGMDMEQYFWEYARNTPFYEELLMMLASRQADASTVKESGDTGNAKPFWYPKCIDKLFPLYSKRRMFARKAALKILRRK